MTRGKVYKEKKYSGYRSYQYLDPGKDFRDFKVAEQINRVKPCEISMSEEEEKRVENIFRNNIIISLHEHPRLLPKDMKELSAMNSLGREYTGYRGLAASGMDAVFDNFLDGSCIITSKNGWKWNDVIYNLGMKLCDVAHQDLYIPVKSVAEILSARENGRVALIPSLEAATMIENEVDRIDILYGLGIRCMGLVYSESNSLGSGLKEERDGGLTYFGHRAVERMNKLGMAIDISHAGDRTGLDVIDASRDPIFITHAGARALRDIKRLKPDAVLKACAEKGGVIGIEAAPHTTLTRKHPRHNLESVMEHFEYCVELVGIEHVAFGPDTNFGDHVRLHHEFSKLLSIDEDSRSGDESKPENNYEEVEYVRGMENPSENFPNIVKWLVKHGYSEREIAMVTGDNILRVLKEVWV